MQLCDLLASHGLLEMAYTQKKAERIITALERPMNDTLLKLWTSPRSNQQRAWIDDLVNWVEEISEIVLRPTNSRPPHIFYYKLLFFEPFGGGADTPNLLCRLRRLQRQGSALQIDVAPDNLVCRLQIFHRDLATLCAARTMRESQIRSFLEEH